VLAALLAWSASAGATQQRQPVPRPFPTPSPGAARPADAPDPSGQTGTPTLGAVEVSTLVPDETTLGVMIYPSAQYITSYDADRGQRFHLFGTNSSFEEMVRYYSVVLDERGNRVFDAPATHLFETVRFREEQMTYRPGVTIKDYTWNGSEGYLNPIPGDGPQRFKTLIQIVTAPPGETER